MIPTTDISPKRTAKTSTPTPVLPKCQKAKYVATTTPRHSRQRRHPTTEYGRTKLNTTPKHYAARNVSTKRDRDDIQQQTKAVTRHTLNIAPQHETSLRNRHDSLPPQLRRKRSGEGVRQQRPHGRVDAPVQGQQQGVIFVLEGQSCEKKKKTRMVNLNRSTRCGASDTRSP